jgi:ubiquinone/menaquinone biosynthesis C-methylase UbiE
VNAPPLYDRIGAGYDATRRADPAIVATLARLLGLSSAGNYLDLACGTGHYTAALAARGGRWHGIDASQRMLEPARRQGKGIDWRQGDASALPYEARHFDGVMCTLAIHHFADLHTAFTEVARVLDEGPFVLFTAFSEQMRHYWLWRYFPHMMAASTAQMPARDVVLEALAAAGFAESRIEPFQVRGSLQDLFLYAGRQRPSLYLDTAVRANISSFARLCPPGELHDGLAALQADLQAGRADALATMPDESAGDYAFVVARKPAARGPAQ